MPHPTRRIEAFSDAVIAIAITLLVLEIAVPGPDQDVGEALSELLPELLSFVLSFLVIGRYWIAHSATLDRAKTVDNGLLWWNLAFLLSIAFLPFPTALLGEHLDDTAAAVVYALSMAVVGATSTALWLYVANATANDVAENDRRAVLKRAATIPALFVLSIPFAWLDLGDVTAASLAWVAGLALLLGRSRLKTRTGS